MGEKNVHFENKWDNLGKSTTFSHDFSSARVTIPCTDLAYYTGLDVIASMFATHNPMLGEVVEQLFSAM